VVNRSLRRKFIFSIGLILAIWLGAVAYIEIRVSRRQLVKSYELEAIRAADTMEWVIRESMLSHRRSDIQKFLQRIRSQREIEDARIFDLEGRVLVSASEDDIGQVVDEHACRSCHPNGTEQPATLRSDVRRRVFCTDEGHRVLGITKPILNEPACFSAACHIHEASTKTLGVLDVLVSLDRVDVEVARNTRRVIAHVSFAALLVGCALALLFHLLISRPLSKLTGAISAVERGDLEARADIRAKDELGAVARSFNSMTSALKSAHDKLEQQVVQADKLASVGEMMAGIAHEIKSPLSGIGTAAQVLQEQLEPNDRRREVLGEILKQIERLRSTVDDFLRFAKPRKPRLNSENLNEIVERIFFLINGQVHTQGIKVQKEYAPDLPPVRVDAEQMQQVFFGLALNAIQSMPNGGALRIATESESDEAQRNGHASVIFQDTGAGIPPEHMKSIFEPFFTTKHCGTGLGLSIVRRILREHGSTITVESEVGKGTRFTITIPTAKCTETAGMQEGAE
jgi:signal transduction histidine kinase